MKEARIYLLGRCSNPECPKPMHSKKIQVLVNESDFEDSPCKCEKGTIKWERLQVRHSPTKKRVWSWILAAIVSAVILLTLGYFYYELYRFYTSDEMCTAQRIVRGKTSAEILKDLPGSVKYKAHLLQASRGTILRLQEGKTTPTPILEIGIRGLANDYELLKRRPLLFRIRHSRPYDLHYAIPNADYEIMMQQ